MLRAFIRGYGVRARRCIRCGGKCWSWTHVSPYIAPSPTAGAGSIKPLWRAGNFRQRLRPAQPEYWVLKSYLKVVQPYLDAVSCAQLNMFSTARAPEGFYARDTRATL